MKYKCLIVEDEPLAQKVIEKYLFSYPQLELVKICKNAGEAFEMVSRQKIDLLFLDINLPGVSGIQFIQSLKNPPAVIFTTAYSEHAAKSYELEAVDYLLKPITKERFHKSIQKLLHIQQISEKEGKPQFIYIKVNGRLIKVFFDQISFIEARKDYLMVHLKNGCHITHMTMKSMEELLPAAEFLRVHRSYIVSKNEIRVIAPSFVEVEKEKIPVGKKYKEVLSAINL